MRIMAIVALGSLLAEQAGTAATGVLKLPSPGEVTIGRAGQYRKFVTDTGNVTLPAGEYSAIGVSLRATDRAGGAWTAEIVLARPNGSFRVADGTTVALKCGGPLRLVGTLGNEQDRTLALAYRRDSAGELTKAGPRDLCIRLRCYDRAGNMVTMIYGPDGKKTSPPVLRARVPSGRSIGTSDFEYG